jgi:hypothetical protein
MPRAKQERRYSPVETVIALRLVKTQGAAKHRMAILTSWEEEIFRCYFIAYRLRMEYPVWGEVPHDLSCTRDKRREIFPRPWSSSSGKRCVCLVGEKMLLIGADLATERLRSSLLL